MQVVKKKKKINKEQMRQTEKRKPQQDGKHKPKFVSHHIKCKRTTRFILKTKIIRWGSKACYCLVLTSDIP